ncbi:MAG: hypothetical protein ACI85K_001039 [Hyphomicrobiaceae bacterium]|jgi:hypothetical protein
MKKPFVVTETSYTLLRYGMKRSTITAPQGGSIVGWLRSLNSLLPIGS